jgi:purine-binding chemotaxis protein CheW
MTRDRAAELRAAFDRGFAERPASTGAASIDVLKIRLAGEPYGALVAHVASIHVDLRLAPVPSPVAALLGVAAVRGAIVPVYDLRALVGVSAAEPPRWIVLAVDLVRGYAFDGFVGLVRATAVVAGSIVHAGERFPAVDLTRIGKES